MGEQRRGDRRGKDRRQKQWSAQDGWGGSNRRKARDRRDKDRRVRRKDGHYEDPTALKKREIEMRRKEKEREISERKKQGRIRKHIEDDYE